MATEGTRSNCSNGGKMNGIDLVIRWQRDKKYILLAISGRVNENSIDLEYRQRYGSLFLIYDGIVTCPLLVTVEHYAFIRYHIMYISYEYYNNVRGK